MIKISHLITFSLLWNCFYNALGASDDFTWGMYMTPMPNMQQKYISENPGGLPYSLFWKNMVCYVLTITSFIYYLEIELAKALWYWIIFQTLCRFKTYAWPFCSNIVKLVWGIVDHLETFLELLLIITCLKIPWLNSSFALKLLCIQRFWNIYWKKYSDTHLIKKISIS